ncbi:MAG: Gfo/Idh/MocA family oxidoreductase [Gemmataceae bacterium]
MPTRRSFLAASTTALAATSLHAAGEDVIRVGLIGCGDRGTGAAVQALSADKNVKLVAMGDAFADRLQSSLDNLRAKKDVAAKVAVKPEACFTGFDAYKQVIAASDVVLLTTPPHFRPMHMKAAVEAGKHVFAEKPCAVDAPGVRSVLATCELAKKKNLSVVSGLCLRYDYGFQETMKRIHGGEIGDVVTLFANDYRTGRWIAAATDQTGHELPDMQLVQLHVALGDFNVEQHVHFLDVCAWAMKDEQPVKAVGMGGRSVYVGNGSGNIYDHFSIVYEFKNGVRLVSNTRQQPKCKSNLSAQVIGTKGWATLADREDGLAITANGKTWTYPWPGNQMYQTEHDELFASIRSGKPVNNGEYMAKSSLLAIMGRMAAYTGQQITWDMAMHSKEDLSPPAYDWDAKLPDPPIAVPGVTKFA